MRRPNVLMSRVDSAPIPCVVPVSTTGWCRPRFPQVKLTLPGLVVLSSHGFLDRHRPYFFARIVRIFLHHRTVVTAMADFFAVPDGSNFAQAGVTLLLEPFIFF